MFRFIFFVSEIKWVELNYSRFLAKLFDIIDNQIKPLVRAYLMIDLVFPEEAILKNDEYFAALFDDLNKAKTSIDISTYILTPDHLGERFSEIICAATRRGVKVRLLIDGVGGRFCDQNFIENLKSHDVQVKIYHPLPWLFWQWGNKKGLIADKIFSLLSKINRRNHQKICVIDSEIAYIGNANIDKNHLSKENGGDGWRDTNVRLTGIDTQYVELGFLFAWNYRDFKKTNKETISALLTQTYFYLNFWYKQRRKNYYHLLSRLTNAKSRIWITAAYFSPNNAILKALIQARKQNVDVCILLSKHTDVVVARLVANAFYYILLKNDVKIYEYTKSVLHAKVIIVDDWFLVGSSNLNTRSLKHDLEMDINIATDSAKRNLVEDFYSDLNNAQQITLSDVNNQSYFKIILSRIILFFRYWI